MFLVNNDHGDMNKQTEDDVVGLMALRDCLMCPDVNLATIDLMYNRIGTHLSILIH